MNETKLTSRPWFGWATEHPDEGFTAVDAVTEDEAQQKIRAILGANDDPDEPMPTSVRPICAGDVDVLQENSRSEEVAHLEWQSFLENVQKKGLFSEDQLRTLRSVWLKAVQKISRFPRVPVTERTVNGGIGLTWTQVSRTLTLEILPSGTFDWFFQDRSTDSLDGSGGPEQTIPIEFFQRLSQLEGGKEAPMTMTTIATFGGAL